VEVDWIATCPQTRRLSYTLRRSTAEEYVARIEALRALGEGYSEVSLAGRAYPHLTLSLRGGHGWSTSSPPRTKYCFWPETVH
jgi:hypothetical protein